MTPIARARRRATAPAALALLLALAAAPAAAHQGDADYRSVVREVVPRTAGLTATVIDHDDALVVVNKSGQDVTILDPDGHPYARLLADGTVEVNTRSSLAQAPDEEPADAGASVAPPAAVPGGPGLYASVTLLAHGDEPAHDDGGGDGAGAGAERGPRWVALDRAGRFQWHDPRIKYRDAAVPPQVTDETRETKVKDWRVALVVGGEPGAILGTLTWVGEPGAGSSFPTAAVVSLVVLGLLAVGAVVLVRRRRTAAGGGRA